MEKSLSVNLETLKQLTTNFCHLYETEIHPWTDRKSPEFTSLGSAFKRINTLKNQLDSVGQSLVFTHSS